MATALTFDNLQGVPDVTDREEFISGVITFSGNYATGGDTLSFAGTNKIQLRTAPLRRDGNGPALQQVKGEIGQLWSTLKKRSI